MNPDSKNKAIPLWLSISALVLSFACLGVSISQGAYFMYQLADNLDQRVAMFIAVAALILSSQILARITGIGIAQRTPKFMVIFAIAVIGLIELFSIGTSMTAFNSHIDKKQRSENTGSYEYQALTAEINNTQIDINERRRNMASMPDNWISRREAASAEISILTDRLSSLRRELDTVNKSPTAQTFRGIEAATGMKQQHIYLVGAILLSLVPFVTGLMCTYINANGKKH